MRLTTVTVGPLANASATKISVSQRPAGVGALVIDGAAGSGYSANNIATTQSVSGAGSVTINGALASSGVANLGGQSVVIVSAGNDSGITFTVKGTVVGGSGNPSVAYAEETLTGANVSRVATKTLFQTVTAIATSGSTAGNITVGTNGIATLDMARRVLFTPGGNDASITWTIYGTDWNNQKISEVVAGAANPATTYTVYDFKTVTAIWASGASASTLTVGTNGIASSRPIFPDRYANAPTSLEVDVSGTVSFTVQQSLNDPNAVGYTAVNWVSHPDSNLVAAAATAQGNYAYIPTVTRVLLNSGTGSVTYSVLQASGPIY